MEEFYHILIIYALTFFVFIFNKPATKYYKKTDFLYTAVGESLSNRVLAFIFQGYTFRIKRYLKMKYSNVIFNNLSKTKVSSTDLLMQLRCNAEMRQSIKRANIITIGIGANNLLPAIEEDYSEIYGITAKKGIEQFKEDWPLILYFIRNCIGSKARIYVMTLYNPYEFEEPNYSIADYYINGLNSVIKNSFWIKSYDYKIVDIYDDFKHSQDKLTLFRSFIRRPCPNYEGYKKIAENFISIINS